MSPRISIVLPVLNGSNFVAEAISSVLTQSHGDLELTISDNCSDDDTLAIIREVSSGDSRVSVSQPEARMSQAKHVNRVVELAQGDWVKVLCHDDLLEPNCLERLLQLLDCLPDSVGLVGHGGRWLFANGGSEREGTNTGELRIVGGRELLCTSLKGSTSLYLPALTTALVRRRAWENAGGFDERYRHFDVFLWSQMMMDWDFAFLDEELAVTRIHAAQVAVDARRTLGSAMEAHEFWRGFVSEHGEELQLGSAVRVRSRLRGPASAGTAVAIELLKRRPAVAVALARRSPIAWWPLLPGLVARAYRREFTRTRALRQRVPVEQIYP